MADKFFVTVAAKSYDDFIKLRSVYNVDICWTVSKDPQRKLFTVVALLEQSEIQRLTANGYSVTNQESASAKPSTHRGTSSSADWAQNVESNAVPAGYLTEEGIRENLTDMATRFNQFANTMTLPEPSVEGRPVMALRIGGEPPPGKTKKGVFMIAGVHARELVPPDLLIYFARRLCFANRHGQSVTFGGKTYRFADVNSVIVALNIFVMPLVNPDGRVYVQASPNENARWWRKNRRPNPANPSCAGVDNNRNHDFLWSSNIGSSVNPCSDVYKGPSPASEPETRNVKYLLDRYQIMRWFLDIHSAGQMIMYPWGDDQTQTSDPNMSFKNPAWDGQRGHPNDTYREFMPASNLTQYQAVSERMRNAIRVLRSKEYRTGSIFETIYPVTGSNSDYAFSRHLVQPKWPQVLGLSLEVGTEFQPAYSEAEQIMSEVSAGLMELCLTARDTN